MKSAIALVGGVAVLAGLSTGLTACKMAAGAAWVTVKAVALTTGGALVIGGVLVTLNDQEKAAAAEPVVA